MPFGILNHAGVATEIDLGVSSQVPEVGVFAHDVIDAANLTVPSFVFLRPADSGNVVQPGNFAGRLFEFGGISQLPGPAGALENEKFVRPVFFRAFPFVLRDPSDAS